MYLRGGDVYATTKKYCFVIKIRCPGINVRHKRRAGYIHVRICHRLRLGAIMVESATTTFEHSLNSSKYWQSSNVPFDVPSKRRFRHKPFLHLRFTTRSLAWTDERFLRYCAQNASIIFHCRGRTVKTNSVILEQFSKLFPFLCQECIDTLVENTHVFKILQINCVRSTTTTNAAGFVDYYAIWQHNKHSFWTSFISRETFTSSLQIASRISSHSANAK